MAAIMATRRKARTRYPRLHSQTSDLDGRRSTRTGLVASFNSHGLGRQLPPVKQNETVQTSRLQPNDRKEEKAVDERGVPGNVSEILPHRRLKLQLSLFVASHWQEAIFIECGNNTRQQFALNEIYSINTRIFRLTRKHLFVF